MQVHKGWRLRRLGDTYTQILVSLPASFDPPLPQSFNETLNKVNDYLKYRSSNNTHEADAGVPQSSRTKDGKVKGIYAYI